MGKDALFERHVAKELSLWWSGKERDDLFWRSQTSGGRATQRFKKGLQTKGQHGDICATDADAQAFTDRFVVEVKRGYPKNLMGDVLDKAVQQGPKPYEVWLSKLIQTCQFAQVPHWLLIHKRDRRDALIWMPYDVFHALQCLGEFEPIPLPCCFQWFELEGPKHTYTDIGVAGVLFEEFLRDVSPNNILKLSGAI